MADTEIVVSSLKDSRMVEFKSSLDGRWIIVSYNIRPDAKEVNKNAIAMSEEQLRDIVGVLAKVLNTSIR